MELLALYKKPEPAEADHACLLDTSTISLNEPHSEPTTSCPPTDVPDFSLYPPVSFRILPSRAFPSPLIEKLLFLPIRNLKPTMKLGSPLHTTRNLLHTHTHCLCSVLLILSSFLVEQLSSLTCHMKHLNPGGYPAVFLYYMQGSLKFSSPGFSGMYKQGPGLSILQNEMKT